MEQQDYEMMKQYYPQFFDKHGNFIQEEFDRLWGGMSHEEIAIMCYKEKLKDTDYKAIKLAEGLISEEEYAPIRLERQGYRDRIEVLELI